MKYIGFRLLLLAVLPTQVGAVSPEAAGVYTGTISVVYSDFQTQKPKKTRHKTRVIVEQNGNVFLTTEPVAYQFGGTAIGGPYHAYLRFEQLPISGSMIMHFDKADKMTLNFHTAWNEANGHSSEAKGKFKKTVEQPGS